MRLLALAVAFATTPLQFSVIMQAGYSRLQMADTVAFVHNKAGHELKAAKQPPKIALSRLGYLNASKKAVVPCFGTDVQTNLEGFLFPATYAFDARTLGANIVANQLTAFCKAWSKVDLTYATSKGLAPYDVLKIASMVTAEAASDDGAKVAAVIYNRLRIDMPLQIDATLRYGLKIPSNTSITAAQLAGDNPYNTRRLKGLPPTPIGNPDLASMQAAAHPSTLGYLYYARVPNSKPVRQRFFESYPAYVAWEKANGYGPHP